MIVSSIPLASFEVKPVAPQRCVADLYWLIDALYGKALRWAISLENTGRLMELLAELDVALYKERDPYMQVYYLQLFINYHGIETGLAQDDRPLPF